MHTNQIILYQDTKEICQCCGTDLTNITNYTYKHKRINSLTYWDELYECNHCHTFFYLRHPIFTKDYHLDPTIFTEDINDPSYTWTDILTSEQYKIVAEHIEKCLTCRELLTEEILTDVSLKELMNRFREE